jgi:cytochrome c-type biogenesis protein CcmE|tara:strand:+ start:21 stop:422 length:402 start_codon:yes stop_codon:yes gene_type:complete
MLTKSSKNRFYFLLIFATIFISISTIMILVLKDNLLYFKTPTDIKLGQNLSFNKSYRLGGIVKKNSIKISGEEINFIVTDEKNEIFVTFEGSVPNLFVEGKGVVAEGKLVDSNYFIADKILAKHDENYKPPEK